MNKLTCLFGFHDYSNELTEDKGGNIIYLCKICKLNGHHKNSDKYESWYEYDDKSNIIHYKNSDGYEYWNDYDDKGNEIHYKYSNGYERWLHKGECVDKKPKNWEYEKYVK